MILSPDKQTCQRLDLAHGRSTKAIAESSLMPQVTESTLFTTACHLYDQGLNVIPVKRERNTTGNKPGFKGWQAFKTTRLDRAFLNLFNNKVNLAVITGHTSGHLLVADCEDAPTLHRSQKRARDAGLTFWAAQSGGRKGGGCLLMRCHEGSIADIPLAKMRRDHAQAGDLELWGNGTRFVVLPPSIHPVTGAFYEWLPQHNPQGCALQPNPFAQIQAAFPMARLASRSGSKGTQLLTQSTRQFLRDGAQPGERNIRLFSAACDIYGCELNGDRLWDRLEHIARQCDRPDDPFTWGEIQATIGSARGEHRDPGRTQHSVSTHVRSELWQVAMHFAHQHQWIGRTGMTDRAVFLACCQRAHDASRNGVFRASTREIAERANCRPNTASKALKRLITANLLAPAGTDRISGANLYQFGATIVAFSNAAPGGALLRPSANAVPAFVLYTDTATGGRARETDTLSPLEVSVSLAQSQNTTSYRALGRTADLVWRTALHLDRYLTVKQTAARCHISYNQAWRAWKKLLEYGAGNLAVKTTDGLYLALDPGEEWIADQVLAPVGAVNRIARRKAEHRQARAIRASKRYEQTIRQYFKTRDATRQKNAAWLGHCSQADHDCDRKTCQETRHKMGKKATAWTDPAAHRGCALPTEAKPENMVKAKLNTEK